MAEETYKEGETLISTGGDRHSDDDTDEFELELRNGRNGQISETTTSGTNSSPSKDKAHCYVVMAAIMASLGGILFGYDVGIISGAVLQLRDVFCLSCMDQEFVISSMLMGAVLGSLTGGFFIDNYGRRLTIIVNAGVFFIGAVILTISPNYPVLLIGRVIVGYAVSVSATSECIYISEIAPTRYRGLLVSLNELGITLGLLLAYLCNFLFINMSNGWRWMFGLSAIPALIQAGGMFFLPKSPRYLMLKKLESQARGVLQKLRGTNRVEKELSGIRTSLSSERNSGYCDMCSREEGMAGRMLMAIGLVFFQQVTGQPNVLYYAPTIFEEIGFESDSAATLATLGLGITKVVMTIIALLCVDKVGRRKLLLTGAVLMGISIFTLGVVCHFEQANAPSKACLDQSMCNTENNTRITWPTTTPYSNQSSSDALHLHTKVPLQDSTRLNYTDGNNTKLLTSDSITASSNNLTVVMNGSTKGGNSTGATEKETSSFIQRVVGFVALMCYVAAYAFSFGPVVWLVLSEIFPAALKGRAIATATVFNWATNIAVSSTFLHVINGLGVTWTFTMFSIICAFSVMYIFSFVPETKNKSLEQVSAEMKTRPPLKRMRQNCGSLLCCISRQQALHIVGNYSRVQADTVS